MKRSAGVVASTVVLCVLLTSCSDEAPNLVPIAVIDNPGQDTTLTWPDWTVDIQGTASDADGLITGHDWDFGFNRNTKAEDPGLYTYDEVGTDTVTYQAWDDDGAPSATAQVVVTVLGPPPDPAPGDWSGIAEFGELAFTVNDQGNAITDIGFTLEDWVCGGVTWNQTLTASDPSGWPISESGISLETTFAAVNLTMAVHGTFGADHHASGSWSGVANGTTCSGTWAASSDNVIPHIAVFMNTTFTQTQGVVGFNWLPSSRVTLEIDNGANGTVDFQRTTTVKDNGDARFDEGHLPPPFAVLEGDIVKMRGGGVAAAYAVLYLRLGLVDAGRDLVTGRAREGTGVNVVIFDPALPFPEGHEVTATVEATGTWTADFTGVFDILPGSSGVVSAHCSLGGPLCGGSTTIVWQ